LTAIEDAVNQAILDAYVVRPFHTSYQRAVAGGAIALFGEKYGDRVRVVETGDPDAPYSQELCGGTHVDNTVEIGLFIILSEASIGAGLRRIEAVTGRAAQQLARRRLAALAAAAAALACQPDQVYDRLAALAETVKEQEKTIVQQRRDAARRDFESLLSQVQEINGVPVLAAQVQAADMETLRQMTDWFRDRLPSGVIVLGAIMNDKPGFVAAVTADLAARGLHAGELVKATARIVGGGGGGKPTLAQAGGRDASRLGEAIAAVPDMVRRKLA
jgi:alanyl-tRNA synthetase